MRPSSSAEGQAPAPWKATIDAWRWRACAAAPVATFVPATPGAAQDVGLPIGTQAPAAALETLDGSVTNLSSYIGKSPVLIEFWATWCPNCKALEPHMQEVAKKYGDRVKFIAVAVSVNQSPQRVKLYAEK